MFVFRRLGVMKTDKSLLRRMFSKSVFLNRKGSGQRST